MKTTTVGKLKYCRQNKNLKHEKKRYHYILFETNFNLINIICIGKRTDMIISQPSSKECK